MSARADVATVRTSVQEAHHDLTMHSTALRGLTLLLERCADHEDGDIPIPFVLDHVAALVGVCAREAERLADCASQILVHCSTRGRKHAQTATGASR